MICCNNVNIFFREGRDRFIYISAGPSLFLSSVGAIFPDPENLPATHGFSGCLSHPWSMLY